MSDDRYSRQVLFPGIGREGQEKLRRSRALIVGCGALGSVMAEILVRAGVGRLTIADRDYIEESNLQRQSLYTEADWRNGLPKAAAAAERLKTINSEVEVSGLILDVNALNIGGLVSEQNLILDGTDNFETRFLINDASLKWRIPWIYGACVGAYGLCLPFLPGRSPCLRCVMGHMPAPGDSPTCDTAGIIGPVVHLVAALEAAEALKILAGKLSNVNGRLVSVDMWENRISSLDFAEYQGDSDCPACGKGRYEYLEGRYQGRAESMCGRNAVQICRAEPVAVDFQSVAERLGRIGRVIYNDLLLRARVQGFEIALFRDGRSIVRGTQDPDEAKRLYAKYIGY